MMRCWVAVVAAIWTAMVLAGSARAQVYTDDFNLTIPTQSDYNGNDSIGYSNTFGASWASDPNLGPGVSCPVSLPSPIGCTSGYYGWNFNLNTSGQIGLGVSANISGGSIGGTLPFTGGVLYLSNVNGQSIVSAGVGLNQSPANASQQPSLTLSGAGISASLTGTIGAAMSIQATGCLVECTSGGGTIIPAFSTTFPIVAVNTANTSIISIAGQSLSISGVNKPTYINIGGVGADGLSTSILPFVQGVNVGQYQFNTPMATTGGSVTGATTTQIVNNYDAFNLSASLPGIAEYLIETELTGGTVYNDFLKNSISVPGFISGKLDLFDIEAGVDLGLRTTSTLTTPVDVWLHFDQPFTATYQAYSYTQCASNAPGFVTGDCSGTLSNSAICMAELMYGYTCTETPIYATTMQTSNNGWLDLPPGAQDQAVYLDWTDGTVGNLTDRLYQLDASSVTTENDLTITPDLDITALCASISILGGKVYSGTLPCAYQNNLMAPTTDIDLATVTQNLYVPCADNSYQVGSDAAPFFCPPPPKNLDILQGATPDSTAPGTADATGSGDPDPNDITSYTDPNYPVYAPEPPGLTLMAVGLALLGVLRVRRAAAAGSLRAWDDTPKARARA